MEDTMHEILGANLANSHIRIHAPQFRKQSEKILTFIHDECDFFACLSGRILFWVNEKKYTLNEGDVIFINENVPYKIYQVVDSTFWLIQTTIDFEFTGEIRSKFKYFSYLDDDSAFFKKGEAVTKQIWECCKTIIEENTNCNNGYSLFIKSELLKMFGILYRQGVLQIPDGSNLKGFPKLEPILRYIEEHHKEALSLDQISKLFCIEKTYFCKFFKVNMNTTFTQYLNIIRISNAKKLLLATDKSITEIANEVGYSSGSYFTEIFKKTTYCTPHQYRKLKKEGTGNAIFIQK